MSQKHSHYHLFGASFFLERRKSFLVGSSLFCQWLFSSCNFGVLLRWVQIFLLCHLVLNWGIAFSLGACCLFQYPFDMECACAMALVCSGTARRGIHGHWHAPKRASGPCTFPGQWRKALALTHIFFSDGWRSLPGQKGQDSVPASRSPSSHQPMELAETYEVYT